MMCHSESPGQTPGQAVVRFQNQLGVAYTVLCHRADPKKRPAVIPPSLSRTSVPNFYRGNRCLYWMSRSPGDCTDRQRFCANRAKAPPLTSRDRPGFRREQCGWSTDPQTGEESHQTPASRLVAGQGRRRFDGERRGCQKEEKQRFFSPIPTGFRRIYFEAAGYECVNRFGGKSQKEYARER